MSLLDPRALRHAFGSFMTGVTVVTTRGLDGTPVGFTANSFSSVSLDPPLLLVCPGKFLSSYAAFAACESFAVSILAEGQEGVADTFASYKGDRFARVMHRPDPLGNPLIDGALAQFSCETHSATEAGDHLILVGAVRAFSHATGRGLGYAGGQFFSLGLERAALDQGQTRVQCGAIIRQGDTVLLERSAEGFCPPHVTVSERGQLCQTLEHGLGQRGQRLRLGPAYSVFDEGTTPCAYFLADGLGPPGAALDPVPIDQLPTLTFASRNLADMMNRFAREARTRSFGLYLGDARRGDILTTDTGA